MPHRFNITKALRNFLRRVFIPTCLTFGADISDITFYPEYVVKTFKNLTIYEKTVKFYTYIAPKFAPLFPIILQAEPEACRLTMTHCGTLVNLFNLPPDYKAQMNAFRACFLQSGILVLDLRFMPWTPYVLNNICVREGHIRLVDLGFYAAKSSRYINAYMDRLIWQIGFYHRLKNYPVVLFLVHLALYIQWLVTDLIEKCFF